MHQTFLDKHYLKIMEIIDFQERELLETEMQELFNDYNNALKINSMSIPGLEQKILDEIKDYETIKTISGRKTSQMTWGLEI